MALGEITGDQISCFSGSSKVTQSTDNQRGKVMWIPERKEEMLMQ